MGRPRKDGRRSGSPVRIGKLRQTSKGNQWRVYAYGPTHGAPSGRVTFRKPDGKITSRVPKILGLEALFEQIENDFDQGSGVAAGSSDVAGAPEFAQGSARHDIAALGERYLAWLNDNDCDLDYITNRKYMLAKWVYPLLGKVQVAHWSAEHSLQVLKGMRDAGLGAASVEYLGTTLSGLRSTAHRKHDGARWLDRDENPLEGVKYSRLATIQGAHMNYIPLHERPATSSVYLALACATKMGQWTWMGDVVALGAFCALRLGEQLGLRAIDFDLDARTLDVNGTWFVPKGGQKNEHGVRAGFRKRHPKNKLRRTTPYPGSQHDGLLRLCASALGLPENSTQEEVVAAIEAERTRRAEMTKKGDWRDVQIPVEDECWLFVHENGVPPCRETFNKAWHKVAASSGWNRRIPYRNMRHHAALWWHDQGFSWETIGLWGGHTVTTLEGYYRLPVEGATEGARSLLDTL